ncbi:MAG: TPM domain-containing protein [Brachymonas denitrificans]|uniref:TPM domain-containing protein n=1 Tax=Brachymonas denitrificans TaxID=28220 RepID=UPI00352CEF2A
MVLRRLFGKPSGASPAPSSTVAAVLPADAQQRLSLRVSDSERLHCGEIRLCIEAAMPPSYTERNAPPRERALSLFGKLRVWDTEHNNGVLIYLLLQEHAIEIIADRGFNRHVPQAAWARITERMCEPLREGRYEEALEIALEDVTALLAAHFPPDPHRPRLNELPDAPVILG